MSSEENSSMANKLTVLGSGISISSFYKKFDFRNPSGHLLQYNGKNILLDCGDGMRGQMDKIKFDYFDLDAVLISHFHPDHFNVDSLIQSLFVRAHYYQKVKKSLKIFGPTRIEQSIIEANNNKHYPIPDYYHNYVSQSLVLTFRDFKDQETISIDKGITATAYGVEHASLNAYAMRFQLGKTILSYSGDSGYCDGVILAARGADLFICEAGINIDQSNPSNTHLSAYQAGEIAGRAGAKHLVLVHYSGRDSSREMIKAAKSSGFKGKVDVAGDLDSFAI